MDISDVFARVDLSKAIGNTKPFLELTQICGQGDFADFQGLPGQAYTIQSPQQELIMRCGNLLVVYPRFAQPNTGISVRFRRDPARDGHIYAIRHTNGRTVSGSLHMEGYTWVGTNRQQVQITVIGNNA